MVIRTTFTAIEDVIFQPEVLIFLIPIAGIFAGIIMRLLKHQKEMAELVNRRHEDSDQLVSEVRALRSEMSEMRDRINSVVLSSDVRTRLQAHEAETETTESDKRF